MRFMMSLAAFGMLGLYVNAQEDIRRNKEDGGYIFEVKKEIEATKVKDQNRSATCWSFSALSFFESELMRKGQGQHDLSEMFIVRHTYADKAKRYVRMHGKLNFGAGGAFHDVTHVVDHHGIVPEQVYSGGNMGYNQPVHSEMDAVLKSMVDAIIKNPNGKLTTVWHDAYNAVLDEYLGEVPEEFEYEGNTYTPESFADKLDLNADNYVEISSFTHHPFHEQFTLEVPDNWLQKQVYNVKLDEMMQVINHALDEGYSVAWAADVSDPGFSHKNGVAIVPEMDWDQMDKAVKDSVLNHPVPQSNITQEKRQKSFDNYATTDDHAMHITGIAEAQNGDTYYIVKNSWGDSNECGGYLYASKAYVKHKTIDVMVHQNALPKQIRKELGIKKANP